MRAFWSGYLELTLRLGWAGHEGHYPLDGVTLCGRDVKELGKALKMVPGSSPVGMQGGRVHNLACTQNSIERHDGEINLQVRMIEEQCSIANNRLELKLWMHDEK